MKLPKVRGRRAGVLPQAVESSRGTKFLAAGAAVAAIGLAGGSWAYAASSGGAALTPAGRGAVVKVVPTGGGRTDGCPAFYLTPVPGVPSSVMITQAPTPVPGTPVVCDGGGTTAG